MVTIFSALAVIFTLAGAWAAHTVSGLSPRAISRTLAFSAGVLLAAAFAELLPEAFAAAGGGAAIWTLAAVFVLFTMENFTVVSSCHEVVGECGLHEHAMGVAALAALSAHSLLDGFNIAVGFSAGGAAGVSVALGVIMHKFADGVALISLLAASGRSQSSSMVMAGVLSLATPAGALAASLLLKEIPGPVSGGLLAFSAGSFVYIALADVLPRLHRAYDRLTPLIFAAGAGAVLLSGLLAG